MSFNNTTDPLNSSSLDSFLNFNNGQALSSSSSSLAVEELKFQAPELANFNMWFGMVFCSFLGFLLLVWICLRTLDLLMLITYNSRKAHERNVRDKQKLKRRKHKTRQDCLGYDEKQVTAKQSTKNDVNQVEGDALSHRSVMSEHGGDDKVMKLSMKGGKDANKCIQESLESTEEKKTEEAKQNKDGTSALDDEDEKISSLDDGKPDPFGQNLLQNPLVEGQQVIPPGDSNEGSQNPGQLLLHPERQQAIRGNLEDDATKTAYHQVAQNQPGPQNPPADGQQQGQAPQNQPNYDDYVPSEATRSDKH